jgi:TonB family protein
LSPDAKPTEAPEREAEKVTSPEDKPEEPKPDQPEGGVKEPAPKLEEAEKAVPTPPPVKPAVPAVTESAKPVPASPATPQPGAAPVPVPSGSPGEQADKEADATSIKTAVEYRNGRVQAGEGIDIVTVKPEFSNFTVLTSMPRTPVVEITFTTRGKVKNVRMLQSSGYKDVDEPIVTAVWAWKAKGKKLEALAKQNPNSLLKISIRMLL